MWRSYLTVAIRALAKNRTFTFINIFGLALGLAVGLMMLLFVRYETSYDRWLSDHERAYQVQTWFEATGTGSEEMKFQLTSYAAYKSLASEFPQIEAAAYLVQGGAVIVQDRQRTLPEDFFYTDSNIFEILRFPFVRGDARTALDGADSLVLSESESRRRFGTADPLGQVLTLVTRGVQRDYVVRGVFADPPPNTHFRPSMVARIDPVALFKDHPMILETWVGVVGAAYFRLREGANVEDIRRALPAWEKRNVPDDSSATSGGITTNPGDSQDWKLVNIADVHLGEAQDGALTAGNDPRKIATFAVVALLILAMAIANFTNLATARASQRAREVALRKVLGATRRQLIAQFVSESILITALAMMFALAMVELALPWFNSFVGTEIRLSYFGRDGLLLPSILLVIAAGVIGGIYPAFCLSRFEPTRVLKANKSAAEPEGSGRLRNMLVVAQFAVSIGLIICTAIIYTQTLYALNSDAGYNRRGLIQVNRVAAKQAEPVVQDLKRAFEQVPGVVSVAQTSIGIDPPNYAVSSVRLPGNPTEVELGYYGIDPKYIETMGMTLLAGRGFSEAVRRDDATTPYPVEPAAERDFAARGANVVLSEQAARRLGFASPQAAIGKDILTELTYPEFGLVPATIVGVVKDVRYRSIRDPIQPIMYFWAKNFHNALMVRYEGASADEVIRGLEAEWARLIPGVPFDADIADQRVRDLYRAERAQARIFGVFAILAVVIACLGLFGLAAFTAERRTKEIGIRKVLGASTPDIVRLLTWQFSKPVILANLIAWPVAWWVMRDWLSGFDARIPLGAGPFVVAALMAIGIAIGTIAGHAVKVARSNPINALRYE